MKNYLIGQEVLNNFLTTAALIVATMNGSSVVISIFL